MIRSALLRGSLAMLLLGIAAPSHANPYAAHQERQIKALSADEQEGLLQGRGMGMALPAELHGYPGPLHVLEVIDALDLSEQQRRETERLYQAMLEEARPLGARIVELERELDEAFASRGITSDRIKALTVAIGELYGRLRHVHLAYHLKMDALLTAEQKARYEAARGYGADRNGDAHGHGHGHHHH